MRSLVGKWQERRDEKGKARRTGKDKDEGRDGTGQEQRAHHLCTINEVNCSIPIYVLLVAQFALMRRTSSRCGRQKRRVLRSQDPGSHDIYLRL